MNNILVNKIAQSCLDWYKELPKTGKPVENEWTVLSCVVQYENGKEKYEVVSLGTGSKCIGAAKMNGAGNVLNDSHAEVIARRGFLLYLYEQIDNMLNNRLSIFYFDNGTCRLKQGIEFIFYSSQLPCGDASIIPKTAEEEYGNIIQSTKRPAEGNIHDVDNKKAKLDLVNDIYRTGAKCLLTAKQDPKESGVNYHSVGQVRTKPGRGDETLSVSCSDKLARWIHVGIQGALLDMLLAEPIYIKYFIYGAEVPYSNETLERAFLKRNGNNVINLVPSFYQSTVAFPNRKTDMNTRPAASSIIWVKTNNENGLSEASTQGVKQGLIKKRYNLVSSYLCISKYKLYQKFQKVVTMNTGMKLNICDQNSLETVPYNEMKSKAERYIKNWKNVKDIFFKTWTKKPDIWNFCVHNT